MSSFLKLLASARSLFVFCSILAVAATPLHAAPRVAAINIHWSQDWLPPMWADVVQNTAGQRIWQMPTTESAAPVDSNGWPTQDARLWMWAGQPNARPGTYRLYFTGQATVTAQGTAPITVQSNTYTASTNSSVVVLSLASSTGETNLRLLFSNTSGGVRDVKLMRPISPGSTTSHATTEIVDRVIRDQFAQFDIVRYMDPSSINANPETTWSTRRLPGRFQNRQHPNPYNSNMNKPTSVPWEYIIAFANATQTDAYICLPAMVDADYMTRVARTFRYGSDGVNPYTSTQSNPVWPPLDSNLNLYVEYGNELWNGGENNGDNYAFSQSIYALEQAQQVVTNNINHIINHDGWATPSTIFTRRWDLRARYVIWRAVEMSRIFRTVFGDSAMMTRVRPLWCYQIKREAVDDQHGMAWANAYYTLTESHPITYFFWGAGPATYRSAATGTTIDNVWNTGEMVRADYKNNILMLNSKMRAAFGVHFVSYEGMPNFGDARGSGVAHPLAQPAFSDIRMYDEMIESYEIFEEAGGTFQTGYVWHQDYRFGYIHPDTHSTNTPRALALIDAPSYTASVLDSGQTLPFTYAGANYQACSPAWKIAQAASTGSATITGVTNHSSYLFRSTSGGNFNAQVNYSTSGAATFAILVHGALAHTVTTGGAVSNVSTALFPFTLPANFLSSVTVQKLSGSGSVTVNSVAVTNGTSATTYTRFRLQVNSGTSGAWGRIGEIDWMVNSTAYPNPHYSGNSANITGTGTALWEAYDNSTATSSYWDLQGTTGNLALNLGSTSVRPTAVRIRVPDANRAPATFTIAGSNDGTNWTTLYTQSSPLTSSSWSGLDLTFAIP